MSPCLVYLDADPSQWKGRSRERKSGTDGRPSTWPPKRRRKVGLLKDSPLPDIHRLRPKTNESSTVHHQSDERPPERNLPKVVRGGKERVSELRRPGDPFYKKKSFSSGKSDARVK